jgi:hypothetical protein
MSKTYTDLIYTNFPDGTDDLHTYSDVTASTKDLVNQYYTYKQAGNDAEAANLISTHPELNGVIITHEDFQRLEDRGIAQERFYKSNVLDIIAHAIKNRGQFSSVIQYNEFDIVAYNNQIYWCTGNNVPIGNLPTDTSNWVKISFQGESGTGMAFHTTWSNETSYTVEDCVPYSNRLYVCIQANYGKQPDISPDYWKSVVFNPKQILYSVNQPENQAEGDIWLEKKDSGNVVVHIKNDALTYDNLYPTTKAEFTNTDDGNTVQNKVDELEKDITTSIGIGTSTVPKIRNTDSKLTLKLYGNSTQTVTAQSEQLFDKTKVVSGYLNTDNGTVAATGYNDNVSELISVDPSTSYKIVGHTYTQPAGVVGLAWYNSVGTFLSGANYAGATGNGTYVSPENAYYVRYTINQVDLDNSIFELDSSTNVSSNFTSLSPSIDYPSTITDTVFPQTVTVAGEDYSIPLNTSLSGFESVKDTINFELQKMIKAIEPSTLDGTESWILGTESTKYVAFSFSKGTDYNEILACNKLTIDNSLSYASHEFVSYQPDGNIIINVRKIRMSGWSDTWTTEQKVSAFKTWLTSNIIEIYLENKVYVESTLSNDTYLALDSLRVAFISLTSEDLSVTTTIAIDVISRSKYKQYDIYKAGISTLHHVNLLASGWQGSTPPFSYNINLVGITSTSLQQILPETNMTDEQENTLIDLDLREGVQSNNVFSILTYGEKPAIDIPIRVIIRGDL